MSYQVKRTITSLVAGILIVAAYCFYTFGKSLSGDVVPGDLKFWAAAMLFFVGLGIVVQIAVQILFHIFFSVGVAIKNRNRDEKEISRAINASIVEDEMDRLIELKSLRIGYFLAGTGFIAAIVGLLAGASIETALNISFLSFVAATLVGNCAQLVMYGRSLPIGQK